MKIVAGIDVSKDFLDVCLLEDGKARERRFASDPKGIRALARFASRAGQAVLEATGGYQAACARALHEAGVPVFEANPAQASWFARSKLRRNKTDKADARVLALMALEPGLRRWEPETPHVLELRGIMRVRDDLAAQRAAKKAQAKSPEATAYERAYHAREILRLDAEIRAADAHLRKALAQPEARERADRLRRIPGVGDVVCLGFLALVPEGLSSAKQAAAFCGLAPRRWESGRFKGQTKISKQGDPRLRRLLYLAATHARKDGGPLQAFYERMLAAKGSKKSALCALAHKLARILWAVACKGVDYDPDKLTNP